MKTTIGTADECLMRHNPIPRDNCPRSRDVLVKALPELEKDAAGKRPSYFSHGQFGEQPRK